MPIGLGDFPIILGRPWLRLVGVIHDLQKGIIALSNGRGDKKQVDIES